MVGMASSFGNCDFQTPHGGPPFQGWRKGCGFGYAKGAGGAVLDPSVPHTLRFTPVGERALASSAFWRRKTEVGQATGFGIGDRPQLSHLAGASKDGYVAPNSYGDTSRVLQHTHRSVTKSGITLKGRFPEVAKVEQGPGPAKYDTRTSTGDTTKAFTMQPRLHSQEFKEALGKPGPSEYDTRIVCPRSSPVRKGTVYHITMGARLKSLDLHANIGPGPAKYTIEGDLDKYGLAHKIANVAVPREMLPKSRRQGGNSAADLSTIAEEEDKRLTRVESSPN
jgi:hypothetical protein